METLKDKFQKAFQSPLISEMNQQDLTRFVSRLIVEGYIMLGYQNYNDRDICVLTAKLMSDLQTSYSFLHRDEVALCFELGAKGEYGDYNGINVRTFARWLKGYRTSDFRFRLLMEREEQKKAALPPVSKEYNDECMRRMIAECFERYKKDPKEDMRLPSVIYRGLRDFGYIHHTREEKEYAMSLYARWRPRSGLPLQERDRQGFIILRAQEWLVKQYFGSISQLPFTLKS